MVLAGKRNAIFANLFLLYLLFTIGSWSILPISAAENFTMRISPAIVDISPGIPGYFSIKLSSLSSYEGPVYFELILPDGIPKDFAYSFQPDSSIVLLPNGFGYVYLKVEIPSSVTTAGEYTLTVKGSSKAQTLTSQIVVRINFPSENFGISVSPPSQTAPAGSSTAYTVYLKDMGRVSDQVTLLTYDFPDGIMVNFNPVALRPPGTSMMSVVTSSSLAAGTYYLAIGGEYKNLRHTFIVGLTVTTTVKAEFDLSVQPTVQYMAPGGSTAFTILIVSKGGFNSPVALTVKNVPSGITATLSSASVTPPADGVGYSILMISTPTYGSPTGSFTMLITGTSGNLVESASAMLTITTASQFALTVSPSSQIVARGHSVKYDVTVSSIGQFSSNVSLGLDGFPPGVTYDFSPSSVKPATGGSASSTLTVKTSEQTANGTYTLIISGQSGGLTHYSSAALAVTTISEFVLSVSPTAKTMGLGETASFSVTGSSIGGFSSEIELQLGSVPAGISYSFDPATIKPTPTSAATSTLKLSAAPDANTGVFALVVVGKSKSIIHSSQVELALNPGLSYIIVSASPNSIMQESNITVTGSISPAVAGAVVTLTYTKPDGTNITRTVRSLSNGNYSDSYVPMDPGGWAVSSSWGGDPTHTGAKSSPVQFQVTELTFIERYATILGVGGIVIIALLAGALFYIKRGRAPAPPPEKIGARPPSRPVTTKAPPVREEAPRPPPPPVAPRPAAPAREAPPAPPPRPVVAEKREAPPLVLPRKRCSNCGEVISAQARFCDKCRAPQPEKIEKSLEAPPLVIPRKYCSNCGEVISAEARFCDKCRAPQPD